MVKVIGRYFIEYNSQFPVVALHCALWSADIFTFPYNVINILSNLTRPRAGNVCNKNKTAKHLVKS